MENVSLSVEAVSLVSDDVTVTGAKINASISNQTDIFGYVIPEWATSSFAVLKVGFAILESYQTAQYRAAVLQSLKAIYEKLEHIESRIEDLHDKIDLMFEEIDLVKELISDVPDEIILQDVLSFTSRWKLGEEWTDDEFFELYKNFYNGFLNLIDPPESNWLHVNYHKLVGAFVCCMSGLSRYCYLLHAKDGVTGEQLHNKAEISFQNKRDVILELFERIAINLDAVIESKHKLFIETWNNRTDGDNYGFSEDDRAMETVWESAPAGTASNGYLEDKEFLRKFGIYDLTWKFKNHRITKESHNYFRGFHHLRFDQETGLFQEINPMLLFPSHSVELREDRNDLHLSTYPEFDLFGESFPFSKWGNVFSFDLARSVNPIFKNKKTKRHRQSMKKDLREINQLWKLLIVLNTNKPLLANSVESLQGSKYWAES